MQVVSDAESNRLRQIDILMITHNRPEYTSKSLPALLDSFGPNMNLWVWQNGEDRETLEVVRSYRNHPRFHRFHPSKKNVGLTDATNWLWKESKAWLVGKFDDDILVSDGWWQGIVAAHRGDNRLGAISCWNYAKEDWDERLAKKNIRSVSGGHRILENSWIGGGSYLMKRQCVISTGLLTEAQSYPQYCIDLAWQGWLNGWLYPIIWVDHFDDPRSVHTRLLCDEDIQRFAPLTYRETNSKTLLDCIAINRKAAVYVQSGRRKPGRWFWIRKHLRSLRKALGI